MSFAEVRACSSPSENIILNPAIINIIIAIVPITIVPYSIMLTMNFTIGDRVASSPSPLSK